MLDYLDAVSLLDDCQSEFRRNRNTTSLLLGLTYRVRNKFSQGGCCVLLSLDFEKTFDRINNIILVEKLYSRFNFSTTSCKLMYSYTSDRKQYVCCNDYFPKGPFWVICCLLCISVISSVGQEVGIVLGLPLLMTFRFRSEVTLNFPKLLRQSSWQVCKTGYWSDDQQEFRMSWR